MSHFGAIYMQTKCKRYTQNMVSRTGGKEERAKLVWAAAMRVPA